MRVSRAECGRHPRFCRCQAALAERAGTDEDHATKGIRAVFDTLREVAPGEEFDEVMTQLPREFGALVGSRR